MLRHPMIKICGVTRPRDVELLDGRVDYVGFIVGASRRSLHPAAVAELASTLSRSTGVLVAAGLGPGEALEAAAEAGLRVVQLHRAMEPWELLGFVEEARGLGLRPAPVLIRARPGRWLGASPREAVEAVERGVEYVLVDADKRDPPGGPQGLRLDPQGLREAVEALGGRAVVAAAGGIRPGNACLAAGMGAGMVDVSSGVEEEPGVKSPVLVEELLRELRSCGAREP